MTKQAGWLNTYDRFVAAAMALAPSKVRKLNAHVNLVTTNGARGVAVVLAHEATIRAELIKVSVTEIRGLAARGVALLYAHNRVLSFASAKVVKPLISRGFAARARLMAAASPLVNAELLPAESVAKLRRGTGPIDAANDLLALDALFRTHWPAVANKTTITPADLREAAELGGVLLAVLHARGVKKVIDTQLARAIAMRDRMWTLYEDTWLQHVWRAGAWLFGREVDDHIPLLLTHNGRRRRAAPVTPAAAGA